MVLHARLVDRYILGLDAGFEVHPRPGSFHLAPLYHRELACVLDLYHGFSGYGSTIGSAADCTLVHPGVSIHLTDRCYNLLRDGSRETRIIP